MNAIGQRTGVTTTGTAFPATPSWLWGYDSLGQVITADSSVNTSDRAYQYDSIGNRKKSAESLTLPTDDNYTANALNQYSSVASVNPAYDFDGNATAYPLPVAPSTNSDLTWDAENRLISSTVGTTTKTTLYDAQSRRIADKTGSSTAIYIYDGFNCIAEYTGTTLSKTRLWGLDLSGSLQGAGGVGGLLAEKQGGNFYYPTYDGNGNVSEYVTSAGVVTAHFEYDPFGNTVVNTDSSNQFAYRFSTKPLDFATGLYYYGYRFYDPLTGRWPSRDPIEEEGGVNLYGFVGNNGLNKWDFLGMRGADGGVDRSNCKVYKLIPIIDPNFKNFDILLECCDGVVVGVSARLNGANINFLTPNLMAQPNTKVAIQVDAAGGVVFSFNPAVVIQSGGGAVGSLHGVNFKSDGTYGSSDVEGKNLIPAKVTKNQIEKELGKISPDTINLIKAIPIALKKFGELTSCCNLKVPNPNK